MFKTENRLGEWSIENGVISQTSSAEPAFMALDNEADVSNVENYTLELKAKKVSGAEGFLINFGVKGNNFYWWNLGGWGNTQNAIEKGVLKGDKSQFDIKPGSLETGKWYNLKIVVRGENAKCYLDGKLTQEITDVLNFDPLYAHVGQTKEGKTIIKIVNVSENEQDVQVLLKGANFSSQSPAKAKVTILSGDKADENTFDNPENIVPYEEEFDGLSNDFVYKVKPYSLTIIESL